jgi:hypothetical protein
LCGSLTVAGRDVGQILISEGLAQAYVCNATSCPPRRSWCGYERFCSFVKRRPSRTSLICFMTSCRAAGTTGLHSRSRLRRRVLAIYGSRAVSVRQSCRFWARHWSIGGTS